MREETPPAGDLAKLESAVAIEVFGCELRQGGCDVAGIDAQHGGEVGRGDRLARDHEERLDGTLQRISGKVGQTLHCYSS